MGGQQVGGQQGGGQHLSHEQSPYPQMGPPQMGPPQMGETQPPPYAQQQPSNPQVAACQKLFQRVKALEKKGSK